MAVTMPTIVSTCFTTISMPLSRLNLELTFIVVSLLLTSNWFAFVFVCCFNGFSLYLFQLTTISMFFSFAMIATLTAVWMLFGWFFLYLNLGRIFTVMAFIWFTFFIFIYIMFIIIWYIFINIFFDFEHIFTWTWFYLFFLIFLKNDRYAFFPFLSSII